MCASNMSAYNIVDINTYTYKMCIFILFVHNDSFEYRKMISFSSLKYIFDLFLKYCFKTVKKIKINEKIPIILFIKISREITYNFTSSCCRTWRDELLAVDSLKLVRHLCSFIPKSYFRHGPN